MSNIIIDSCISATVQIRGRSYTLSGSANLSATTPGGAAIGGTSGNPAVRLPNVKLGYHEPFNDALSLGTLGSIVSGGKDLIDDVVIALNLDGRVAGTFKTAWNEVSRSLKDIPQPLGSLYINVLASVELRITDIELSLEAPAADNTPYSMGNVTLGFGFDCSQIAPDERKLLGITLQAIGVKFSVGLSLV